MLHYYVTSNWGIHFNTLSVKSTRNTSPMTDNNYMFNNKPAANDLKGWIINYLHMHYKTPENHNYYIAISKQGYFKTMKSKKITNHSTGNYSKYLCFNSELSCSSFLAKFKNDLRVEYRRLGGTNPLI